MLTRVLGLGVGASLVGEGAWQVMYPEAWARKAAELAEEYLPDPLRANLQEFTRLSPDAIRLMGVGEMIAGWVLVRLALRR